MPIIPDQELEKIRSQIDIVQIIGERIPVKRSGRHFKACCPFHQEKTPSFMINPERQIFHCFGCGEGGDVFSFLMKFDGYDFPEAVEKLADRLGMVLSKAEGSGAPARSEKDLLFRINSLAARFFQAMLTEPLGRKGKDYLTGRGFEEAIYPDFGLGYAPGDGHSLTRLFQEKKVPMDKAVQLGLIRQGERGDYYDFFRDRVLMAITSSEGKVLGFSGRALESEAQPKYINSPESPIYRKSDSLFGIANAKAAIREKDRVILVEGNFDLIRLHQFGLRNVVAPLGTALTQGQIRVLARWTQNFVLVFDGDAAGQKAADRALALFLPLSLFPSVVLLPDGEDPDSFVQKKGLEPLLELIEHATLLFDHMIEKMLAISSRSLQGQSEAIQKVLEILSLLPGDIEKTLLIQRVAGRFGIPETEFDRALQKKKAQKFNASQNASNFSPSSRDDGERGKAPVLPAISNLERTILEVLLSEKVLPETLFREISDKDFSHPLGGDIWRLFKEDFERHGVVDIARMMSAEPEGPTRRMIAELVMGSGKWEGEGSRVAADCLRQLRMSRIKGMLQSLSQEIRRAETENDLDRIAELLNEKNRLMKEMMNFH